jgi:hypothetical protein
MMAYHIYTYESLQANNFLSSSSSSIEKVRSVCLSFTYMCIMMLLLILYLYLFL